MKTGTRKILSPLKGHDKPAGRVAFSPDGKRLASAGQRGTVMIWAVEPRQHLVLLEGHAKVVNGVAVSPDGQLLALAGADRGVTEWEVGPDRLAAEVCRTVARNLTCHEWRKDIGADTPYRKTCEVVAGPSACDWYADTLR